MVDTNPFIAELCENSHYIERACWHWYDSIQQKQRSVIRVSKFQRDDSGINLDKSLDILDGL